MDKIRKNYGQGLAFLSTDCYMPGDNIVVMSGDRVCKAYTDDGLSKRAVTNVGTEDNPDCIIKSEWREKVLAARFSPSKGVCVGSKKGANISDKTKAGAMAVPLGKVGEGQNASFTFATGKEKTYPILMNDPANEELNTIYMFGDERFDLMYVAVLGNRLEDLDTLSMLENPTMGIQVTKFITNMGDLLAKVAKGGSAMAETALKALNGDINGPDTREQASSS